MSCCDKQERWKRGWVSPGQAEHRGDRKKRVWSQGEHAPNRSRQVIQRLPAGELRGMNLGGDGTGAEGEGAGRRGSGHHRRCGDHTAHLGSELLADRMTIP